MAIAPAETGMVAARAAPETAPMNSRREEMLEVMNCLAGFERKEFKWQIAIASSTLYNV